MAVMAVCAVNLDLPAVDINDSVLDLNRAEADVLNDVFVAALDNERVKIRHFVAPKFGVGNEHLEFAAAVKRDRAAAFFLPLGVKELVIDLRLAGQFGFNLENCLRVLRIDALSAVEIGNVHLVAREQVDLAEDSRIAEFVLIFKI